MWIILFQALINHEEGPLASCCSIEKQRDASSIGKVVISWKLLCFISRRSRGKISIAEAEAFLHVASESEVP